MDFIHWKIQLFYMDCKITGTELLSTLSAWEQVESACAALEKKEVKIDDSASFH